MTNETISSMPEGFAPNANEGNQNPQTPAPSAETPAPNVAVESTSAAQQTESATDMNTQPQNAGAASAPQQTMQQPNQPQQTVQQPQQTFQQPQNVQPQNPGAGQIAPAGFAGFGQPQAMTPAGFGGGMMQPYQGQPQNQQPVAQQTVHQPTMASMETDFDDRDLVGTQRFPKLNQNEIARISFLLFNERGGARLLNFMKYFLSETKKDFLAPTDAADLQYAIDEIGKSPMQSSLCVVFRYFTDPTGRPFPKTDDNNVPVTDPQTGQIIPAGELFIWSPSKDKIGPIRTISQEHGLKNVDVIMKCVEPKYQKFEVINARDRWLNNVPTVANELHARADKIWNTELIRMVPKAINSQQLRALIGEWKNTLAQKSNPALAGGFAADPFAMAGNNQPSGFVGQGGVVSSGGVHYAQGQSGVGAGEFSDMLANASQNFQG